MKKLLIVLMLADLMLAGCSGLIAKGQTAAAINTDVALMRARVATTQPADALAQNAASFRHYYDTATVNLVAYLFGKPTIYCTPIIYGDLRTKALLSAEYDRRMKFAATQPSVTSPALWLESESKWMDTIKAEREGVRP